MSWFIDIFSLLFDRQPFQLYWKNYEPNPKWWTLVKVLGPRRGIYH